MNTGIFLLFLLLVLVAQVAMTDRVMVGSEAEPFVSPVTWPLAADWRR